MSDSSTSLRRVLSLPEGGPVSSDDHWKGFHERLNKEFASIKSASLPDLASKIGELLDIEIPDVLMTSWKKLGELQSVLEESKNSPEATFYVGLAEHTVSSEYRPYIEVRVANAPVKKIEFTLRLLFELKGCILKIREGAIAEAQTGSCDLEAILEYADLALVKKKLSLINLPGSLALSDSLAAKI